MNKFANLSDQNFRDFATIYNFLKIDDKLPDQADAIIGGGEGAHIDIAERAAEIWHAVVAPIIIFSGYKPPSFARSESEIQRDRVIELGVPPDKILIESRATNSGLNIILSARILQSLEISPQKIILVHKPYMTRRFKATAQKQWPIPNNLPEFFATSVNQDFAKYFAYESTLDDPRRRLGTMLNDFNSIRDFAKTGFGVPQEIPDEVIAAYENIVAAGFLPRGMETHRSTAIFANGEKL